MVAAMLGAAGGLPASSFAPEGSELAAMPESARLEARWAVENILEGRTNGARESVVQIGDMLFRTGQLVAEGAFTSNRWPNGVVYYQFDDNVYFDDRQRWLDAAAEWSKVAKLTFVEGTGDGNYIHVQSSFTANYSYIGMIGGPQIMEIMDWDWKFIIAHEIGHALGMIHEHCRNDRDEYVRIFPNNIQTGYGYNFQITKAVSYGAYDFESVMHYSRTAFSWNGRSTIQPQWAYRAYAELMGQLTHLTDLDKAGMAKRYGRVPLPPEELTAYKKVLRQLKRQMKIARRKMSGRPKITKVKELRGRIRAIRTFTGL